MLNSLRKEWQGIWECPAGERFESRFRRTRREKGRVEVASQVFRVALALAFFAVGVVFIFLPLPELPFFLLSGGLLATESLSLARFLDRTEMRLRATWEKARRRCGLTPLATRLLLLAFVVSDLALGGRLCYRIFQP